MVVCLSVVIGLALLLRTRHLTDITMYFDECCSWKISQFPWSNMLDAVSRDAHPPGYYVLMKGLGTFVGDSPGVIRGCSVFFGLATVLMAFSFVRTALAGDEGGAGHRPAVGTPRAQQLPHEAGDRPSGCSPAAMESASRGHGQVMTGRPMPGDRNFAAVLAAALVAGSTLHVELSMQARPYTLGTFLTLVSAAFLLRGVRPAGTAWDWIGFTVAATLLSLTHYYGLFTVAAECLFALTALIGECRRTGWNSNTKRLLASCGLSAWGMQITWSYWLPVFLFQRAQSTTQLWMQPLDWRELCANCWMAMAGGKTSTVPEDWAWLAITVWSATVVILFIFGNQADRLAALCAGLPLAAIVVYCIGVRNILGVKYLAFAHVFLLVAWGMLAARIPWRPARVVVALGLLVWGEFWCWRFEETRAWQASFPGIRGAVESLELRRRPEEPVVVGSPFVYVVVQKYAKHPGAIYVSYGRDHRSDMLAGPPLCEAEYQGLDSHFGDSIERAWTIDVYELFGPESSFEASLPRGWVKVHQEAFRETYGLSCLLAVREYRRESK